jgi:hypothetical protein
MPYAAFSSDCQVLTNPSAADLQRAAAQMERPGLMIFGYAFDALDALAPFTDLQILKIQGAPRLQRLDGIERIPGLKEFVLATPTGSDGSGKVISVESFAPLERAATLRRLILLSVRPADLDLGAVMRMTWLEELDIGGVPEFVMEHFARLAVALPNTTGRCLQPYAVIPGVGRCRKCDGQSVLLNGAPPRARKWVCPKCNAKAFAAHVSRWEALTGRPFTSV